MKKNLLALLLSFTIASSAATVSLAPKNVLRADTDTDAAADVITDDSVEDGIPIDEEHFPDPELRAYINGLYNRDDDRAHLSQDEIAEIKRIGFYQYSSSTSQLTTLKGIEYLTSLEELTVERRHGITSLDLSQNKKLKKLSLEECNNLATLVLPKTDTLETIWFERLPLITSVDLTPYTALTSLSIRVVPITAINLTKNTALVHLDLQVTDITSINLSKNTVLEVARLSSNSSLTGINVSYNTKLKELSVNYANIGTIDVSKCVDLEILSVDRCGLTSLNLSKNTKLQKLNCEYNDLGSLDLKNCPDLWYLWAQDCELTSLDLSKNKKIKEVVLGSNDLTTLDLSNAPLLERLSLRTNPVQSLDLSKCPELTELNLMYAHTGGVNLDNNVKLKNLYLSYNEITSLDLSKFPDLEELDVVGNDLTSLDLSHNPNLSTLRCDHTKITALEIGYCPDLYILWTMGKRTDDDAYSYEYYFNGDIGDRYVYGYLVVPKTMPITGSDLMIPINEVYFPDEVFREYVRSFDTDGDSRLNTTERDVVKEINVYNKGVASLVGIEHFTKIESLDASKNSLTSVNLSLNTNLKEIKLRMNSLKEIDVSHQPALEILDLGSNEIGSLDVSMCAALKELDVGNNRFMSIDVSKNTNLTRLDVSGNNLRVLDVSALNSLSSLYCGDNSLNTLDLSNNPNLRILGCSNNPLYSLNLSKQTGLQELYCRNSRLTALNLSKCPDLGVLDASDNTLSRLDVSNLTGLRSLKCSNNKLSSLDISNNPNLKELYVDHNSLTSLDVSRATLLEDLQCQYNQITDLNISNCTNLVTLVKNSVPTRTDYVTYFAQINNTYLYLKYDLDVNMIFDQPIVIEPDPVTPEPGPTTPEPNPDKEPSFEDFVERLYVVALGRASEPEGKAFWVDQVVNKGLTGADCARFFMLGAPEFLSRNLTDDEFVEILYRTYFDRDSEPDGKAYWLGRLASGTERAVLVEEFIESVEWCNVCAMYGVKSGARFHKATIPSKNAVKFATRLYTCCLGRDPEDEGLSYWALALTNLDVSGYQAASCFFTLPEFVGLQTTNEEFLTRLYKTFMGRDPEAEGFAYWLSMLNAGTDRVDVMKIFASCPEFQEICNQYGIDRGEI